ncbi:hypothetical protein DPMN_162107 [Dreissena polymorpha]|uniref:Uncharacterized protein n=1 Tax=Dreissena polymorpha TaxID=45954 RepID=A0A9D4EUA3_DREPO|nr:hypothetical protein DPMN_162107 [Dreissena polymorpha]
MPQAMNMKVMKEKEFSPVGPGTMINHVLQISAATRERRVFVESTFCMSRVLRKLGLMHVL